MDLECPYCNKELEVCHDDGFGYEEGIAHKMECSYCNKQFVFYTSISISYEAYKADCLNGEPHDWKLNECNSVEFSTMHCSMCDKERKLTEEEKRTNSI